MARFRHFSSIVIILERLAEKAIQQAQSARRQRQIGNFLVKF
jgi:hypothetical protein